MSIFPTQYSVLAAKALESFLSEKYNFINAHCRFLIHNVSDTYIIETDDENYVFKIYRDAHRSKEEILAEVELLMQYKIGGASVSYPLQDSSGEYLQSFNAAEGIRYGVLYSYAKGNPVYILNDEHLELIGTEMAKLHIISETVELSYLRKEYNIETTLSGPIDIIKPAFKELEQEYEYLRETTQQVINEMSKLDTTNFSYGYCQYDFLPKNFHFEDEDKLTFFDFDFAGKGFLINDITTFYIHFFLDVYYGKMSREEADRSFNVFLKAYRKFKPVSDEEVNSIKWFGFGFWMFYFGFHHENFDDWSNIFYTPNFIKNRIDLLKKWMDY